MQKVSTMNNRLTGFAKSLKMAIGALLLVMAATAFNPAFALSLQDAKAKGLVGEQSNGYLGAVKPSGPVNNLVKQTNDKRKKYYQDIAKRNKTKLADVERLAGQKAIQKTAKGHYIKSGGGWKRK